MPRVRPAIADALDQICNIFGVPFFAKQKQCVMHVLNKTTYLSDNIHPTARYGQRLGYQLGDFRKMLRPLAD